MSYRFVDSFRAGPGWKYQLHKQICEVGASGWFYYKAICYDAQSHERKILPVNYNHMLKVLASLLPMNLKCTCA